jgi:hypothetical protein
MISFAFAKCHLCKVPSVLNVVYAECCFTLSAIYVECFMLFFVYVVCHLF